MGGSHIHSVKQLEFTADQLQSMRAHLDSCLPNEGCGLLAGMAAKVYEVIPIANSARSPVRYRMEPLEQLRAFDRIDANGLELVGIFHSHPAGPKGPSATDIAESSYRVVQVIGSPVQGAWKFSGFLIEEGRVSEVKLYAVDGTQAI